MTAEEELISDIGQFCADPARFVRYAYPWGESGALAESFGAHEWQTAILGDICNHLNSNKRFDPLLLAVASGHGIGKSALVGWIIHWAMSTCDDCRCVVTANTGDQLMTKTVPEVSKWFSVGINAHWWKVGSESIKVIDPAHEKTWRTDFLTWSLERTEAFAGLHNRRKRIVLIFDEASAIPDKIWEVAEGALTDEDTEIIWVAFGNPTLNTGRFRECFGRRKGRWITRQIDSRSVPGTNKAQIEKWIEDYGLDSDFCRVRVRGEFPRAGSAQFISSELVALARRRTVTNYSHFPKILAIDVARFGDDQTVLGIRQGPKLRVLEKLRGLDVIQVAMRAKQHIEAEKPRVTVVDGDGIGAGVVDWLRTYLKWQHPQKLIEFHGGATPGDGDMYFNQRAESWGMARAWLLDADIPDDPELEADLTGPEYFFSAKNQIQLERKDDMKKRGLASPDIGDMLAMTFIAHPAPETHDERLEKQIEALKDNPMEQHFVRLRETERRNKVAKQANYWD
jgi:hypothetical protein